jgi:hypothetical protein
MHTSETHSTDSYPASKPALKWYQLNSRIVSILLNNAHHEILPFFGFPPAFHARGVANLSYFSNLNLPRRRLLFANASAIYPLEMIHVLM